jgi:hypothetical protein
MGSSMRSRRIDLWLYRLDRLGTPGKLGLIFLAASLIGLLLFIIPAVLTLKTLTAQISARADTAFATDKSPDPAQVQPGARARSNVPASALQTEAVLRQIFAAATASGIQLERGDYTAAVATRRAGGNSTQISLPLKGSYPQIRQFIAAVMNSNPAIAIDQIRLSRDSGDQEELTGTLSLILLQGGRP